MQAAVLAIIEYLKITVCGFILQAVFLYPNYERKMKMKETICTIAGLVGGFIAAIFGGWDSALVTLVIFMGIDFSPELSLLP